jgi:hypothetical protein
MIRWLSAPVCAMSPTGWRWQRPDPSNGCRGDWSDEFNENRARNVVCLESYDDRENATVEEELAVDRVIANVGYCPDRQLSEELQVHECYASSAPMKLAAALLGDTSADCTAQSSHGPQTLQNPEPGLFILGAKSYGRDNRFLIQIGLQQIVDVFTLIVPSDPVR